MVAALQEKCVQLVWNMVHHTPAKEKLMSKFKEIVSAIKAHWKSASSELHTVSYCVLYLLGEINCGRCSYDINKREYLMSCHSINALSKLSCVISIDSELSIFNSTVVSDTMCV